MKRRTFLKQGAWMASGIMAVPYGIGLSGRSFASRNRGDISRLKKGSLEVLILEGPPKKRGQIHGEGLRAKIQKNISLWKESVQKSTGMKPDAYIAQFMRDTDFLPAIKKWTPALLEEVEGLAEGAGIDFDTMYAYQLGDEHYWYIRNKRLGVPISPAAGCSALGVSKEGDRFPLLAQNMDIESYYDGTQTLLHIKYPGSSLESLVFTIAGYLALTGLNNRPLGICCNTLLQLNYSPDGLPVAYIVRAVLEKSNLKEAGEFLRGIKHASGQNYTIGDAQGVAAFEGSANKVSQFIPFQGSTRVYHTNHPLANDDQSVYQEIMKKSPPQKKDSGQSNSEVRFDFLAKKLADPSRTITVEMIKSILGSDEVPICFRNKPGDDGMTFGCLIMELSPHPVLHLSPGPPCDTEFQTFRF
jgi:isopenicillin-N N-acyltransferase-like protein